MRVISLRHFLLTGMVLAWPLVARAAGVDTYEGEMLLRTTGDRSIVIALDESKSGFSDELFTIQTRASVAETVLRSDDARIDLLGDRLTVTLREEKRILIFDLESAGGARGIEAEDGGLLPALGPGRGVSQQRFDDVATLLHENGPGARFRLDDLAVELPRAYDRCRLTPVVSTRRISQILRTGRRTMALASLAVRSTAEARASARRVATGSPALNVAVARRAPPAPAGAGSSPRAKSLQGGRDGGRP